MLMYANKLSNWGGTIAVCGSPKRKPNLNANPKHYNNIDPD